MLADREASLQSEAFQSQPLPLYFAHSDMRETDEETTMRSVGTHKDDHWVYYPVHR